MGGWSAYVLSQPVGVAVLYETLYQTEGGWRWLIAAVWIEEVCVGGLRRCVWIEEVCGWVD